MRPSITYTASRRCCVFLAAIPQPDVLFLEMGGGCKSAPKKRNILAVWRGALEVVQLPWATPGVYQGDLRSAPKCKDSFPGHSPKRPRLSGPLTGIRPVKVRFPRPCVLVLHLHQPSHSRMGFPYTTTAPKSASSLVMPVPAFFHKVAEVAQQPFPLSPVLDGETQKYTKQCMFPLPPDMRKERCPLTPDQVTPPSPLTPCATISGGCPCLVPANWIFVCPRMLAIASCRWVHLFPLNGRNGTSVVPPLSRWEIGE